MPNLNGSNLASADYDEEQQILTVRFRAGTEYRYSGVPKEIYQALLDAPSAGSFFARAIKGQYQSMKM